jgi:aspartate racemase
MQAMRELIGIVGGMGPLASAEFVKTIYECNLVDSEQNAPSCVLLSDPGLPDRSRIGGTGEDQLFIDLLKVKLESLLGLNASVIVVACVTSHHFLTMLPPRLTERIVSLVDLILDEVIHKQERSVLLCSNGTRHAKIFERHQRWSVARRYIALPDEDDQSTIHDAIYQLKRGAPAHGVVPMLAALADKYEATTAIAGCTEFHLVTKCLVNDQKYSRGGFRMIDPLLTAARNVTALRVPADVRQ